jgi:anti-sigma B factor antagonist
VTGEDEHVTNRRRDRGDAVVTVRGGPINTVRPAADDAPFHVTLTNGTDAGEVVASVDGELDAAGNPLLQSTLLKALRRAERVLTIDLSGVTFFGSAGVTALVWVSQHPEAAGKHVRVVATSRIVTGPLELTGLLARLDVQGMPETPDGPPPATPAEAPESPGPLPR